MSRMPPSVRSSRSSSLRLVAASCFGRRSNPPDCGLTLQLLEGAQAGADRDEVGQRAAEPAPVDEELAGARCLAGDDFLRLLLGADEEDATAARGDVGHELRRRRRAD